MQRALLGYITPNLRAVEIKIEDESKFKIIFYFNSEISENEEELTSLAETEFVSDFPPPEYQVDRIVNLLPYPKKIPQVGFLVYKRYEK